MLCYTKLKFQTELTRENNNLNNSNKEKLNEQDSLETDKIYQKENNIKIESYNFNNEFFKHFTKEINKIYNGNGYQADNDYTFVDILFNVIIIIINN